MHGAPRQKLSAADPPTTPFPFRRLFQSLSGAQVLQHYERVRPVNYEALSLLRFAVLLPLVTHIMGCGLFIVAEVAADAYDFRDDNGIQDYSRYRQWLYGIYWASMTLSTIGYGDVGLVTSSERAYAIVCMMVGATMYAYLCGAIINIILTMGSFESERQARLKAVNLFMAEVKVRMYMYL
ncbi:hypothetical protein JKP88DRAFT_167875 [Tribonema minus]|uniref:Potassium channel domain-containing protein n=1 Tax=Tribonema minus TaxID=303371 RepID=A0A835YTE0_9STRA|nr:hypothetical protein JKP88DRAFT_167875 [Tribonema minus]